MNRLMRWLFVLTISFLAAEGAEAVDCQCLLRPVSGSTYEVTADTSTTVRKLQPEFFGFNIEWVEFQWSLWDSATQRVKPDAVEFLKAIPGAVYRYPGGTVANYFEWRNAIGDVRLRKAQSAVPWSGPPLVVQFGLVEYLKFVQSVGGRPWYVLNLYGSQAGELPSADMVKEAGAVAAFFRQQNAAGLPAVLRYELGNELDRGGYMWGPGKYSAIAGAAISAVTAADPKARAVALAEDYDALWQSGITATDYNSYEGRAWKGQTTEFANHRYYDGRPWGHPIPDRLLLECKTIGDFRLSLHNAPVIWVTEHAKTPEGTSADPIPKANWPQTANLDAAISVSDMLIALSQMQEVSGAMSHALHATTGPWPIFHLNTTGAVVPSAVYWGMRTLRETMLDEVLPTRVVSANQSGYEGGYDMRGVALANTDRSQFSVWLTNRANVPIHVKLTLPALAGNSITSNFTVLANSDSTINNYGGVSRISPSKTARPVAFNANGQTYVDVPANAVMAMSLAKVTHKGTAQPIATHRRLASVEK